MANNLIVSVQPPTGGPELEEFNTQLAAHGSWTRLAENLFHVRATLGAKQMTQHLLPFTSRSNHMIVIDASNDEFVALEYPLVELMKQRWVE